MTPDVGWGKRIEVITGRTKGTIRVDGEVLTNPAKKFRMPPDLAPNFRYLAMRAFLFVNGDSDSSGQSRMEGELLKLKQRFPGQEPEEVWKSSLAKVIGDGVTAEEVATSILESDPDAMRTVWMGDRNEQSDEVLSTLASYLTNHWPSAKHST